MKTYKILVSGHVQGVFFRASARELAKKLNLKGYAKNLDDGRVEMKVSGEQADIDEFIEWSRKGPSRARVDAVNVEETTSENFVGFITK